MDIEIRSFQPGDEAGAVELLERCLHADRITPEVFQRKVLLDQNFDVRGAPVALSGGKIVGFALGLVRKVRIEDAVDDFDRSWITLIAVDSEFRRKGIASRLVAELENYFRKKGCTTTWVSPYAPNYFIPGVDVAAYPEALGFFSSLGFEEILRPLAMDADMGEFRIPDWVLKKEAELNGVVAVEPFRPELILPLLDWMRQEFPGDWQRYARESMTRITLGEFEPDNVWIAHEHGRVVGYAQHGLDGRFGPFGVSASQRGRGIGAVLLFRCMDAMRNKGLRRAWLLWTDDKTARLYAEAGFRETRRFAILRKMLQDAVPNR